MAIYHASTKPIARSAGRSAVAAAAYRAGVELVDARTGLVHDYTRKGGVEHTEILTPDGLGAERNALWDAAELAEKRKDARTAREWIVALPAELTADQRKDLARDFGQCLVARYGVAVDFAIHAPDREGDHRNHHAHILTTTRQVSRGIDGGLVMGAKAHIELSDKARRAALLGPFRPDDAPILCAADEVKAVRALWERTANAALERAGLNARIDARSFEAQGTDREATQHLGPVASEMERRGKASDRGDGNRQVSDNNRERARLSAEIIDLHAERERRERREVARREFEQSHREPAPDHLSVTRAVAALVATQAQRARQAAQDRWTERRQQRATRHEREVRRKRLVALADALAKDPACRLPLRQAYLDAGYQVQRQGDKEVFVYPPNDLQAECQAVSGAHRSWNQRKQGLERDRSAEQETRPGIRHPDKPHWQAERERILTQAYNADVAEKMGRWYRVEQRTDALVLSNKEATVTDYGDRVTAAQGNDREVAALVALAQAKGWERVSLTGPAEFQERAARAFVEAGIGLTDARLEQTAREAIEADRRAKQQRPETRRPVPEIERRAQEQKTLDQPPPPLTAAETKLLADWQERIADESNRISWRKRQEYNEHIGEAIRLREELERLGDPGARPERGLLGIGYQKRLAAWEAHTAKIAERDERYRKARECEAYLSSSTYYQHRDYQEAKEAVRTADPEMARREAELEKKRDVRRAWEAGRQQQRQAPTRPAPQRKRQQERSKGPERGGPEL